jgi:hypothetical protein
MVEGIIAAVALIATVVASIVGYQLKSGQVAKKENKQLKEDIVAHNEKEEAMHDAQKEHNEKIANRDRGDTVNNLNSLPNND